MSVDFNINSPSQGLTLKPSLSAGQTYQGSNYQWSVSTGGPQGSDSLPAPKPTNYLGFSARGAGVVNQHQTGMVLGNPLNFEIFRFSATGYDPIYNWVFRIHYGDQYEVFGYADISSCECDSCDAVHQKRVFTPCTLGYPDQSTSRAPTIFNEDLILYSYGVTGDFISYYYADEYPLMLGIGYVQDGANAPLETAPGLGPVPTKPICLVDPNLAFGYTSFDPKDKYGALDNSGTGNGCNPNIKPTYTCGRPIPPVLFLTDITDNPASRAGDWQQNGTLYFPNKVCGLFFYTRKIILNPRTQADGTINANILGGTNTPGYSPPPTNTVLKNLLPPWDFGVGADPIPVQAPTNPKTDRFDFGVQIAWDVKKLPLQDARNYRFQIMAHDGDSTKIGGDIGEACVNVIVQCDAGFKNVPGEPPCSTCDVTPLPGDGKWTWFCTPVSDPLPGADSPIANPYNLVKIPVSKLTVDPFKSYIAAGTGFIPKEGQFDKFGFAISCDCKRTVKPCPLNCCGNGKCDYTKGTCTCAQPANQLQNTTTCCPTLAPTNAPTPPPTPAPTPFPFKCPNDCCSRVVCNGNNGQCVCPPPYNAAPYNATDCCLLKTPSPTPQPTPPPLKCPNDCCSRVVCNAANGQCACPPPFNAAPYNSTDCCLLPTPSPTPAPTPAPTTPAPTEFNAPTEAPTPPTQAPTPAPTPAPTDAPCFNNGKYCNGNGICNVTVPVCVCTPPFFGADCSNTTNAPTNAPTPGGPCFNEGKYCNGNGICNETIPACVCTPPFFGVDCSNSTNSPTAVPSPTGPCFNDGKFCSGANGNCVNDTCVCVDARLLLPACEEPPCFNNGTFCSGNGVCTNGTCICDKPEYLQPSCEAPPPPLTQCENITNGTTCLACLLGANAIGINCVFCPQNITLADGSVVQDTENGVCSQTCPGISVATCQPVITVIPPVCPDNCSGVGICVNVTVCDQLRADNIAKYGNDSSTWPLDCGDNANTSRKYNQTGACACYQGYAGLNCALFGAKTLVALAALGAGLIALIVVLAILGAAMAGGGAMAASSGMGQATEAVVTVSPIYEGAGLDGQNPLFSNDYQMMGNG